MSEMGTFRIDVEIENPARAGERRIIGGLLVDTGSELSWIPARDLDALGIRRSRLMRFRQATGQIVERWVGIAIVHVGGIATGDDVVFAEGSDLSLLGSRTLELATEAAGEMTDQKDAVSAGYVLGKSVRQHVDALTAVAIERHAHLGKPERDARANEEVWAQIKASPQPPVPSVSARRPGIRSHRAAPRSL